MHYRAILDLYGATNARLREILTATDDEANVKIRKRIEKRVKARIDAGLRQNLKNASMYQAIDCAWDAPPISKEILPLMLWAQGKVSLQNLGEVLKDNPTASQFVKANDNGTVQVNLPKLHDITISLIRSYVTRRHAAQTTKYANLWPFLKYEPRGTDNVSSLQADVLSQVVEKISDDFNYRHLFPQSDRDKLLYGFSVVFPRQAWTRVRGWRFKDLNIEVERPGKDDVESYVLREGLDYVNPHPARIFWDNSAPLANLNTDNGPTWIGYWDMIRFGALVEGQYFNLDKVTHGEGFNGLLSKFASFFEFYFEPTVLKLPEFRYDPSADNDRSSNVGRYSGTNRDNGVMHTQYFEKVNPKEEGICDYNMDVWVRYTVAGDGTIIGAEWLPSIPGCYGGFNQHDGREVSISYAMELLPYQDQLTNLFTQMLFNIRTGMVQLWLLDKDSLEPGIIKDIREGAKVRDFFLEPRILEYSASKLRELGVQDPRQAFAIVQAQVAQSVEQSFSAIMRLLSIVDRLSNVSRNELGESNPREISATEAQEISTTTATMHTFISDGIDEQRAAVKRQLFESLVSCGQGEIEAPVMGRYTIDVIEKAGFKVARQEGEITPGSIVPAQTKLRGGVRKLIYTYSFDSRDGAERSSNPQAAQLLIQLANLLMASEPIVQAMGKRRIYDLANTIVRQSGAGWDLRLELDPGEEEAMVGSEVKEMQQRIGQLEQMIQQLAQGAPPQGGPQPQGAGPAPGDEAMLLGPEQQQALPPA